MNNKRPSERPTEKKLWGIALHDALFPCGSHSATSGPLEDALNDREAILLKIAPNIRQHPGELRSDQ